MLPTLLAVSCFLCGTLAQFTSERVCYGKTFTLPFRFNQYLTSGELAFRPTLGGARQTLIKDGKLVATDPRFTYSHGTLSLRDVTNRDEGFFIAQFLTVSMRVDDCATRTERAYSTQFQQSPVDFDYVEFTPVGERYEIEVLWNRSDPVVGGGRTHANRYVWEMDAVTSLDNGFYNFRRKDNSLVKRVNLYVTGHILYLTAIEGEELIIKYPGFDVADAFWTVIFKHWNKKILMKEGDWVIEDQENFEEPIFQGRLEPENDRLTINPVTLADKGTFEFKDSKGFLILTVEVTVEEAPTPAYHYVLGIAGFLVPMFLCCCCIAKCCGEEDASKSEDAAQNAAAPENQDASTSPSHSYPVSPAGASSYQPVPLVSSIGEPPSQQPPAYDSLDIQPIQPPSGSQHKIPVPPPYQPVNDEGLSPGAPPSYDTVLVHETLSPPASEFTAPGPSTSTASDSLSSAEPRFDIGRMTLPSAPPLDSDTTFSNVYNSDKLNFL